MKISVSIIDLFKKAVNEIKKEGIVGYDDNHIARKLNESDYFRAYLVFLDNCIFYSRINKTINNDIITNSIIINDIVIYGKQLNAKVNKWKNDNIINKMLEIILYKYIDIDVLGKTKYVIIDSQFVPNRFMSKNNVGRNVQYKSKYGLKISSIVDKNGIALSTIINSGNVYDGSVLIDTLNNMFKNVKDKINPKKYELSKKHKKYFMADAGYDSNNNINYLREMGYHPLIDYNKRNTKDLEKIKEKQMTKLEKKIYKKRIKIENHFGWKSLAIPRTDRIYDKDPLNFLNQINLISISTIINRGCV
jgi:hypothetical protein